jgi:hypothetical protein
MTDGEIITMQTRKIMEQEADATQMQEQLKRIRMRLVCIGAPLNDNALRYSKAQLEPFFRIQDILNGCSD